MLNYCLITRSIIYFVFCNCLFLAGPVASAQDAQPWTDLGVYGGMVNAIAIDPRNSGRMLVATYLGQGLYQSIDGGASWQGVDMGLSGDGPETFADHCVFDVVISQANPDVIWVAHNKYLAKSTDGGQTWLTIDYSAMQENCENCRPEIDFNRMCRRLVVHPLKPDVVFVGTTGPDNTNTDGAVFKSEDGGSTWVKLNHGDNLDYTVRALALDPADPNILWAGTHSNGEENYWTGSIYRSIDGGASWERINPITVADEIFTTYEIFAIVPHPLDANVVFVGCYGGLLRLEFDRGQWRVSETGSVLNGFFPCAIKVAPSEPARIYVCGYGEQAEDGGYVKLWYSMDGGMTWCKRADIPAGSVNDPVSLAIHPAHGDQLFLGDYSLGLKGSTDAGATWVSMNQGLDAVLVRSLDTDPQDHTHLLAASSAGIFERRNSGAWVNLLPGTFYSVLFDPVNSLTYYAGEYGRVYKTVDGGQNWNATDSVPDMQARWVRDIDVDPADTNKFFIALGCRGEDAGLIMRSTDGGASFATVHRGVNKAGKPYDMNTILVDPADSLHILAGGGDFDFPYESGDLWQSTDGGIHWERTGLTNANVNFVLIDPVNHRTWYAGCGYKDNMDSGDTLFKSTDGGLSWTAAAAGMPGSGKRAVTGLAFHRTDSKVLYASTLKAGVFISPNQAGNWLELGTPPFEVYAITSGSLYAGTSRGVCQFTGTGVLAGRVCDGQTDLGIDGATISTDFGNVCYSSNGDYMMVVPAGIFNINAGASGYSGAGAEDVPVLGSEVTWSNFNIFRGNEDQGTGVSSAGSGSSTGGYCFISTAAPSR